MKDCRSRLILALDVPDRQSALATVEQLSGRVGFFKLGLQLFVKEGPSLVAAIRERGEKVFLDLKLHDIPNTVAGAVRSACSLGVEMLTLHAAGGPAMLEAARKATEDFNFAPMLVAVTALTSLSDQDFERLGIGGPPLDWVEHLADLAQQAGLTALVASPLELHRLRQKFGREFQLIVPGIRPSGVPLDDQARTATPSEAIRAGADLIVVGRPILEAPDPASAAAQILREIEMALELPSSRENALKRNP